MLVDYLDFFIDKKTIVTKFLGNFAHQITLRTHTLARRTHIYNVRATSILHNNSPLFSPPMSTLDIPSLLSLAADAAIRAGEAIIEVYTSPTANWEVERKADNSPLTLADRRSHAVIAPMLEQTGINVLSEEGAHLPYAERQGWTLLWIVDPLDGTKEFIKRNGEFTVNIALADGGVPVLGVIFVPVSRVLYIGSPAGAFKATVPAGVYTLDALDLAPIHAGAATSFTVVASRSHLSAETQDYIDALRPAHPDLAMVSAGSSLKLCLVAEGKADVYPRFAPTMEWDTAAGHAICRAAGAEVYQACAAPDGTTAVSSEPLIYNKENLLNPWFIVK